MDKVQHVGSCNKKQKKSKKHCDISVQSTSACKLLHIPQTGLYEYLLTKLKRPAYLTRMRKQLVKHDGNVQYGKDVMRIARKNLVKLLRVLDNVDNTGGLKNRKKETARRLSKLLQLEAHT